MTDTAQSETPLYLQAIALKLCVDVTYNRQRMRLAPHVLYNRNDALYLEAVTMLRDGERPREDKVGAFHLGGLKDPAITDQSFERHPLYEPEALRYEQGKLFEVEG